MIFLILILIMAIIVFTKIPKLSLVVKNINMALMIYLSTLLLFTIIYFILPKPDASTVNVQSYEQSAEMMGQVHADIVNGKIDSYKEHIMDEQSFNYEGKELIIEEDSRIDDSIRIIVDRKGENDGVIEVKQLYTIAYVNGLDVSDKLNPTRLDFKEGQLKLISPVPVRVEMASFKKEFPIKQFTSSKNAKFGYSDYSSDIGFKVMYIRIPKDVIVKNETYFDLTYIRE